MTSPAICAALTTHGRTTRCSVRASVIVGDVPYCGLHAKLAERKAEEDAREAAFWEDAFTPTPGQPWRGDPVWRDAFRDHITGGTGGNSTERCACRIRAAMRMTEIEERYEEGSRL